MKCLSVITATKARFTFRMKTKSKLRPYGNKWKLHTQKNDRSWHPLSWAPNPAKTSSIRIELRSVFLGLALLGNHEEQAHWVPSRDTLVKTPIIVLTEQLENVPLLVQPLGCRVVWLRGKEPFFRLERLDLESVCCGCLVSFRLISPSHSHLSGSRPPSPPPLVMVRARKAQRWWEGAREAWRSYSHRLLWTLFLRGAVGAVKATQLESEAFGRASFPIIRNCEGLILVFI